MGGSGAAGPAPDLRHQQPDPTWMCKTSRGRDILYIYYVYVNKLTYIKYVLWIHTIALVYIIDIPRISYKLVSYT